MREILFRGKRIDNGEWVEGGFFCEPYTDKTFILRWNSFGLGFTEDIEVDPETVGQYTGLKDENGNRIFEGDILSFPDTGEDGYEYKEGYDFTNVAVVCWNYGRWELKDYGDYNSGVKDDMDCSCHFDFITTFLIGEVIGNIHDNPELIAEVK